MMDRFDLRVQVGRPGAESLTSTDKGESTHEVAARVRAAREVAMLRQGCVNSEISPDVIDAVAALQPSARRLMQDHLETGTLSGRGYHRVRRVARTIADLRGEYDLVEESHVELALQMRDHVTNDKRKVIASGHVHGARP